jgi:hypothetical protein
MATITAPSVLDNAPSGEGNQSVHFGKITFAAAAIADKARLAVLPAGSRVFNIKAVNAALGASTTISLGWENVDGSAGGSASAFLAATATSAAGVANSTAAPVDFDKDAYLTATVGGGVATGQFDVTIEYEYKGLK